MARHEGPDRLERAGAAGRAGEKQPFDIEAALVRIREAVRDLPKAALFELAERGFDSVFEQVVACVVSIRTLDEVTVPTALRLFAVARTPEAMVRLAVADIDRLIGACTFHEAKAGQIHEMASRIVRELGGRLGCDERVLLSFRGVGPKCANLALGIACGQPGIGVDVHVHRVVNRWGYVQAATPEKTMLALQQSLPRRYWIELNALLMPFGKHVCTGRAPRCSRCPVLEMCRQVGVETHR
jgi:endonuclease-3